MQHLLLHLPYEAKMGGLCSTIGAIQLRDVRRFFERNAKINTKLKLQLQSHIFRRRCHTSQPNIMVTTFLSCIIHPLITMLAITNRVSAFSEDNLKVQVMRGIRPWTMKSGVVSCYTVDQPLRGGAVYCVSSQHCFHVTSFHFTSFHYLASNPLYHVWYREFQQLFWRRSRAPTPMEMESLLKNGAGNSQPDFIYWFQQKVVLNS